MSISNVNNYVIINSTTNDSATNYLKKSKTDLKFLKQNSQGGPSRFQNEYEELDKLGKGGYGVVFKVRNKIDGRNYAIKRIKLNSKHTQLDHEVELLSKLNHVNVIRYYGTWIENVILGPDEDLSDDELFSDNSKAQAMKNEFLVDNDIELFNLATEDQEFSLSSDSEDESCDEDLCSDTDALSDNSIEFKCTDDELSTVTDNVGASVQNSSANITNNREIFYMYIQMEICEKKTLRTAIDEGLHCNVDHIWRLFRELVEGLAYIHQQNIIHRDLKPENIFVDANDHVKIGDFGLATSNLINRELTEKDREVFSSGASTSMTAGNIGTFLYVAPELRATPRAIRDQRVDIYSLGIILFEMCYGGLNSGMERIEVLSKIRQKEIVYPKEFLNDKYLKQRTLINLLLTHEIDKRPTSEALLKSEHMPPPVLEEYKLRELVRHTLSDPQNKYYKYLIESCFNQKQNEDYVINGRRIELTEKQMRLHDYAKEVVIKIFKLHGGQCLSTPLLMPFSKYYEDVESCVKLMNQAGHVINIPYDLRVPFARYLAWKKITWLKRYSIERVYRENTFLGDAPREFYECAFDIVTPTKGSLMGEAELLSILSEILNGFSVLDNKKITIRLNHTSLLKAILLHCNIPDEKHDVVYAILSKARNKKVDELIKNLSESLGLPHTALKMLFTLIRTETTIRQVTKDLKMIVKQKGKAGKLAKEGLNELNMIILNARSLGVKCQIKVALSLIYNRQYCNGMMCQLLYKLKKNRGRIVLAAGGRYDALLQNYYELLSQKVGQNMSDINIPSAVGVSFLLDKLVVVFQDEQKVETENLRNLDVLVCSEGTKLNKQIILNKGKVLKDLWDAGIRCSIVENQEAQNLCKKLDVPHLVIISQPGMVRVRTFYETGYTETEIIATKVAEFIQMQINLKTEVIKEIPDLSMNDASTTAIAKCLPYSTSKTYWLYASDQLRCIGICTVLSQYSLTIHIVKNLLEPGILCNPLKDQTVDETKQLCKELKVPYVEIIQDVNNRVLRVKSCTKNKMRQTNVSYEEFAEFLKKLLIHKNLAVKFDANKSKRLTEN